MIISKSFARTYDEVGKTHFFTFGVLMSIDNENNQESTEIQIEAGNQSWLQKVEALASKIAEREGCQLYDLEFISRVLRVYIDKEPQAGIADCENVSKGLSLILDVENIVPGEHYQLEVSTPGLDRILKKDWHFERAVNKKIKLKSDAAFEAYGVDSERWKKSRTIEHVLAAVEQGSLVFNTAEGVVKIPIAAVEKARVVFELEKNEKNSKKPNKKK